MTTPHRYYAWKRLDDGRRESTCRNRDCDWRLTGTERALEMAQREHSRTGAMGGDELDRLAAQEAELARIEFAADEARDRAMWEHYRAHSNQPTEESA